ncbi:NAD(P)-dependent oxidoreductase [Variovorax paradoxus]|nr:NAD(P)-dependent oxidoreductase [Variovorax paradoxus]MBT2301957.1 NAD(P)-dependent oxidoreductase [Variovorax paradoxus]
MADSHGDSVLVTGGTGLIGAHVARYLLDRGLKPVLFDAAPSDENIADIRQRVAVERGDVSDLGDLLEVASRHSVSRVIHLAAVLTIQAALKPTRGVAINCIGTSNIFQLSRALGMKRVVYASTAAVYAPRPYYEKLLGRHRVTEDDPPMPGDLYGSTKYVCEGLAAQEIRTGADIVGLRPVMTFGVGRLTGAVGILNQAMRDATLDGRGTVTRPWSPQTSINPMYVKDCADVFVRACLWPARFAREVYNLGTGEYYSIRQMMDLAEKSLPKGASIGFEDVTATEGAGMDVPGFNYADLDSSALRKELDWTPAYGFEAGARECIAMYKAGQS